VIYPYLKQVCLCVYQHQVNIELSSIQLVDMLRRRNVEHITQCHSFCMYSRGYNM